MAVVSSGYAHGCILGHSFREMHLNQYTILLHRFLQRLHQHLTPSTWRNMGICFDDLKSVITCRTLFGSLALAGTCLACDHILQLPAVASSTYGGAVVDNFSHGLVGVVSWAVVVVAIPSCSLRQLAEVILCGLLASLLDVDHFIAARSFELKVIL